MGTAEFKNFAKLLEQSRLEDKNLKVIFAACALYQPGHLCRADVLEDSHNL
jgi:hypothetical protein